MNIYIKQATATNEIAICMAIRKKVFVEGQKVPLDLEIENDDEAQHYLLLLNGIPTGAARIRYFKDKAKIERVAILDEFQGQGLGKKLMEFLIQKISESKKVKTATLGAQIHAINFYEKLGFKICSEEYLDAGISHKEMSIQF